MVGATVEIPLGIYTTPNDMEEIKSEGGKDSFRVERIEPCTDSSASQLGLAEVAVAVTIVQGAIGLAKFAKFLYQKIREKNTRIYRIQGPARTVVVQHDPDLSEESVQALLNAAIGVAKNG